MDSQRNTIFKYNQKANVMVHEYLFEAATTLVTADMVRELPKGKEMLLNQKFNLYKYALGDSVVIVDADDWIEYAVCLTDGESVTFEMLV